MYNFGNIEKLDNWLTANIDNMLACFIAHRRNSSERRLNHSSLNFAGFQHGSVENYASFSNVRYYMLVKILLVGRNAMLREGLHSLLQNKPDLSDKSDMEVVGQAEDVPTAIRLSRQLKPDVAVIDVDMPGMDGIDATRQLTNENPPVKVAAISMSTKRSFILEVLRAGASGYILKERAFHHLVTAIETICAGEVYLCSKAANVIVNNIRNHLWTDQSSDGQLTSRECEVLKMLAEGKASKEIALIIGISIKTVDATRRRIMQKLDIENFAHLVKYAIREGLTSVDV